MIDHLRSNPQAARRQSKAQAMLEFALALPVLLLVVYGLLETGRLIFIYSAVATASREAVRYASAAGLRDSTSTVLTYQDCVGIRNRAKQTGFLLNLQDTQIRIYRDEGPGTTLVEYCTPGTTEQTNVALHGDDRVLVNVSTNYTLLVPIVPFTSRTISSGNTARTFMGMINLVPTPTP